MIKPTTKSLLLAGALSGFVAVAPARAEFELPRENPPAKVSQQVGLTDLAVEYNSPAVKGRKIWGAVVAYDRPWSISAANQPTMIRFGRDVMIGDHILPAGGYRLYAVPSHNTWTLVLSKSAERNGLPRDGKLEADAVAVQVTPVAIPHRERLTFFFSNFDDEKASLDLEWEKLRVTLPLSVRTSQQVMANINGLDEAWRSYANAARYMLESKKDFDTGLRYINQSLALKEDWYSYWIKGALYAAKGDFSNAVEQGDKAYQLGSQLGDAFTLETELRRALNDWRRRVR